MMLVLFVSLCFAFFKNSILHFRMRIFFLEERLAGKGGGKVRKWRSNDGINYDQSIMIILAFIFADISEDKDEVDDKSWISISQYVLHHFRVSAKSERNFFE